MAYQTGTATNIDDFISKVVAFATANGWSNLASGNSDPIGGEMRGYTFLRSRGFSEAEEITVALQKRESSADSSWKQLALHVCPTYTAGQPPSAQRDSKYAYFAYPNGDAVYHLLVNKERIAWIVFSSSHYSFGYMGFMRSYVPRSAYPSPYLVIGNTSVGGRDSDDRSRSRWAGSYIHSFPTTFKSVVDNGESYAQWWAYTPEGKWSGLDSPSAAEHYTPGQTSSYTKVAFLPYDTANWKIMGNARNNLQSHARQMQGSLSKNPVLYPVMMVRAGVFLGEVWGTYMPMGNGITPGDIVKHGGKDHLVIVPMAASTISTRYLAVELA